MAPQPTRRLPARRTLLTIAGLVGLVALIALLVLRGGQADAQPPAYSLITPRRDTLVATVNASGQIAPARVASLSFAAAGTVAAVLVDSGDAVEPGQPLARLDDREARLRADQAEAQLAQAQASYDRLLAGPAAADLSAAEAQLAQAAAQLRQVEGSVTPADLRAAEQQLAQAEARLALLTGGPREWDVQAADARIREAELNLDRQRTQLSAAKTNAALQLDQAVSQLTQSQARYATARQNWEYVQETGVDPLVRSVSDPTAAGRSRPNRLNDAQRQQYYDAFVQAESALRSAESAVEQARVSYDNARQGEAGGVELAEGQLIVARAERDRLFVAPDPDVLAAARAQVASARAALDRLRGDQRGGAVEAARAALAVAQANVDRLRADPAAADLAAARGQVDAARAARDLALLALDNTTLSAPFAGVVAEVNLQPGELPPPTQPAIVLADLSRFHVDVTVDEIDVSRIAAGQPVTLTLDALPDLSLSGVVASVAPLARDQAAVTSYAVRIDVPSAGDQVRAGMSAGADIVVARREGALLVPRRAVRSDRGQLLVDVVQDASLCAREPEAYPPDPPRTPQAVTVGLSNEQVIEIVGGIDAEACVYVAGVDQRFTLFRGPPRP